MDLLLRTRRMGERLEDKKDLLKHYIKHLARVLKNLDSWSAYMITSYEDAERYFGRKADRNRKIYNGMLKTYFYQFLDQNHLRQSVREKNRRKDKMEKIIFATGNEHKMIEIRAILSDLGAEILSQKEAGIKADVVEDGATFEENAMIKATEIAKIANQMPEYKNAVVLADDSGLEIDYLNKEPGIYSARYMGRRYFL